MSNLDQVLDKAMNLPLEQREMLIQILQRRMIEQRRDEIAQDAKLSLAEYKGYREEKLKVQTAEGAITDLRAFIQNN
jgi:adenylate kinase family enzyme